VPLPVSELNSSSEMIKEDRGDAISAIRWTSCGIRIRSSAVFASLGSLSTRCGVRPCYLGTLIIGRANVGIPAKQGKFVYIPRTPVEQWPVDGITVVEGAKMEWPIDQKTQAAARDFPLRIKAQQARPQYGGGAFNPDKWRHRVRREDDFLPLSQGRSRNCPQQIIEEFQAAHYLPALALVVSWGAMGRTAGRSIYRNYELQHIHDTLHQCAEVITKTNAIAHSWGLLVGHLKWSSVIASKTLHFLCRALLTDDPHPPVPIDGAVIRNKVWPCFRQAIPPQNRPGDWEGNSLEAYYRYMTAIRTWAEARQWTTTQMEATIFEEYK
jgi:hypothetical protein